MSSLRATSELTRADARRIAVRAQLLAKARPTDVVETVRRLTLLQLEPTNAVAPSADLVLWSRIGSAYDPQDLRDALDEQRLVELRGTVRPAEDIVLYRAEMDEIRTGGEMPDWQRGNQRWVEVNSACRLDILDRLRGDGPLPSRQLPDTCVKPWRSSGWNNNRNVRILLDLLVQRGEVAVSGREGRDVLWDLAERVYPDDPALDVAEARSLRDQRRLGALGIARPTSVQSPVEPLDVHEAGEPAVVEGTKGQWRVDPAQLGQPFAGRAALLSPFDRLVQDRRRMNEIFDFDYILEMYKPVEQRRWGYYALPILYGDRLVGKLDAKADRKEGVLQVFAVHQDTPFTKPMASAVNREIAALAKWLDVELVLPG